MSFHFKTLPNSNDYKPKYGLVSGTFIMCKQTFFIVGLWPDYPATMMVMYDLSGLCSVYVNCVWLQLSSEGDNKKKLRGCVIVALTKSWL